MSIGMNLRQLVCGAALALAMVVALVAVSDGALAKSSALPEGVSVCNTAGGNGTGGDLTVNDDPQGYVKNDSGLSAKNGANLNAALHSRALAVCGQPVATAAGGSTS